MINSSNNWLSSTEHPTLTKTDVHIWRTSLEATADELAAFHAILSPEEQARAARFRFEIHQRRFTVARAVLRRLLGRYLNVPPASLQFFTTKHGKPYIKQMLYGSELCFNVSHSHEMALYAFTRDRRLGIDIEHERRIIDLDSIARHFFAPAEVDALLSLSPQIRPDAFLNCWTRKEAYIKALGEGLSHPLHTFTVTLRPGEAARLVSDIGDPSAPFRWQFTAFEAHADYKSAIAVESLDGAESPTYDYWQYR